MVRGQALKTYAALEPDDVIERLEPYLDAFHQDLRKGALVGILTYNRDDASANNTLLQCVRSGNRNDRLFAAEVIGEAAGDFSEDKIAVQKDGKWGFCTAKGEWIIKNTFENAGDFSNGFAPAQKDGKWGYINASGEALGDWSSNFNQADFEAAVESSKEYIRAGDVFQVVLSQRLSLETSATPLDIYRALRVVNPSTSTEAPARSRAWV